MPQFPWFERDFARLRQLREQQRLGHAWLAAGPAGIGKLQFVQAVTQWLLCSQPTEQGACGTCQDCHLFKVGTHPDWLLLEPEKRQITVGQVRELIEFAHNTAQRGTKVLVIHPAEAMNLNAANAVLKVLEEPPPGTMLILVSHHSRQLLATLRSRCQLLELPLPDKAQALAWLQAHGAGDDAQRLLGKARGAPLHALALRDNDTLACQDAVVAQLLALLCGELTPIAAAKNCEKFAIGTSIEFLLEACHDLAAAAQNAAPLRDADLQPLYGQLLQGSTGSTRLPLLLHAFQRQVLDAYRVTLAPNNANPSLILEALFGAWVRLREKLRKAAT